MTTPTQRIEKAKQLILAGGRGVELGRRELVIAQEELASVLRQIDITYSELIGDALEAKVENIAKASL